MCHYLQVSCSGYYKFFNRKPSKRELRHQSLAKKVKDEFEHSKRVYGSPRIAEVLNNKNIKCSRVFVAKLMIEQSLKSKITPKFTRTTDSSHGYLIADNLLDRNFNPTGPGMVWVSDITYIYTLQAWCYLTIIMDLFDRSIIGWSMSSTLETSQTSVKAMKMALKHRKPEPDMIFHSDRGSQFACHEFKKLIQPFRQSMSRKGNCWDNAVAESFFKSLKSEWINDYWFTTRTHAAVVVFEYIEAWYNSTRLHSSLNYHSPKSFMENYLKHKNVA